MKRLRDENLMLREVVSRQFGFDTVVGRSPAMQRMLHTLAAKSEPPRLTDARMAAILSGEPLSGAFGEPARCNQPLDVRPTI